MSESHAGSIPVVGAARQPSDLTVEELVALPPRSARPTWMTTRFPVSMEEYRALELAAREPDPQSAGVGALVDLTTVDQDREVEAVSLEAPEGETVALGPVAAAPGFVASFDGIPQTPWQPPDCTIAVGSNDVLVAVNTDLAGYTKGGALRFRWPNMTTLFSPVLPSGASLFDPRVLYDHYTGRWVVIVPARRNSPAGSWLMVAVSQGSDPANGYWIWALDATLNGNTATSNWADYPMVGFDTQAIYIACNMFQIGGSGGFQYVKLRILNKSELYAGGSIRWYDFWDLRNPDDSVAFSVQPAVHFRGTGGNPDAYLVNSLWPSGSSLTFWTLTNPLAFWTSGGSPSLNKTSISCRNYDLPPDALQLNSSVRIDTGDIRLLNAIYQNVGNTQRVWTAHTTKFTWSGDSEARSALQWYEIDIPSKTIMQQNAFGTSGKYYFYPAIQTDISRNAYVVFSRSGADEYGQMRQTGRKVSDAANDLQGSSLVKAGEGSYTGGRWGDYFGICRDGGDSSIVWMYGQYAATGNTWATRVCATKF